MENVEKLAKLSIIYKINVRSEDGKVLREKFNLIGVPTVILLSKEGKEIDRIIGYDEKEDFLRTILLYFFNIGTLDDLLSKSKSNPTANIFFDISNKYYERGDFDNAINYINQLRKQPSISENLKEKSQLLEGECFLKKEPKKGIEILNGLIESSNSEIAENAFDDLSRYYRKNEDYERLIALYRNVLPKRQNDAQFLNSFAWTLGEIERNLDEALDLAKRAVELSNEDPQILDTLAEIYYKKGDIKNAVITIEKAVNKDPNDEYYKKQKEKFLTKGKEKK